jgi:hypothetical protein
LTEHMYRRTRVVLEAWYRQLLGYATASEVIVLFEDANTESGFREVSGSGQSVVAGPDNHYIKLSRHE